jgi:Tol biopolymer transport system component
VVSGSLQVMSSRVRTRLGNWSSYRDGCHEVIVRVITQMKNLLPFTLLIVIVLSACSSVSPTKSITPAATFTPTFKYTLTPSDTPVPTSTKMPTPTGTNTPKPPVAEKIAFVSSHERKFAIYIIKTDGSELTKLTDDMTVLLSPRWSPDGKQIIFSACLEGEGECVGNFDIFSVNADGSQLVNLTNNQAEDMNPDWSPDGKQIVFNSNRSGNHEIYSMTADGKDIKQLTNNPTDDTSPHWSPDGSWIAYESTRYLDNGGWYYEICILNPDGVETRRLIKGVMPHWSPDSTNIAFSGSVDSYSEIFMIKLDGTGLKNLSNSSADEFNFSGSPDGKLVAFVTNRDSNAEIYTVCVDCGDNRQINITNGPTNDQHPSWSPDGTQIAFLSDESVCVMNTDGSQKACFDIKALGAIDWKP